MTLATGEQIARLHRIIHNRQPDIEAMLLEEDTLVAGFHPGIGHDNWRPARPDVNRELNHELAVFRGLGVITHAADSGNSRTFHQRRGIRADEQRDIGGHPVALLDGPLHFGDVDGLILWPALRCDLIPPAINAETDDA